MLMTKFLKASGIANTVPLALDTLKELVAALNNDSNFATSVQTQFTYEADKATTYTRTETNAQILKPIKQTWI